MDSGSEKDLDEPESIDELLKDYEASEEGNLDAKPPDHIEVPGLPVTADTEDQEDEGQADIKEERRLALETTVLVKKYRLPDGRVIGRSRRPPVKPAAPPARPRPRARRRGRPAASGRRGRPAGASSSAAAPTRRRSTSPRPATRRP